MLSTECVSHILSISLVIMTISHGMYIIYRGKECTDHSEREGKYKTEGVTC